MGEGVRLWSTRAGKMAWSEFPPGPCAMRFRGNLRPGLYDCPDIATVIVTQARLAGSVKPPLGFRFIPQ